MTESKERKVHSYKPPTGKVRTYKPEVGRHRVEKEKELQEVKQNYPTVQESVLRSKLDIPSVLTHRARRAAKKLFPKRKQIPFGYELLYKMGSCIDPNPQPTEKLKLEWMYLDSRSVEMFHKKFDNLSKQQKSRLIDSLHTKEA